jgi:50S ribosomal protein L16 3-hydroxylase
MVLNKNMQILGGLSRKDFLKQYWQKKPLLIRQAFPDYQSPLSAEELAGLACEEGVESRLILEQGGDNPWQVRHGPFVESDFTALPESHWSLLVQAVDHHIPELACLLDEFDFIPNWRIDDLMISFAQVHGNVGPHMDNYDVFLLQVQGKRHWHINDNEYTDNDFMFGTDLRLLKSFESKQDWILEPGDMLYLPPGIAHHGIALDDCMTFSIGFRAPTQKELLSAFIGQLDDSTDEAFYSDPELGLQESSGEIKAEHIKSIRELMLSAVSDEESFSSWFGSYITENARGDIEYEAEELNADEFHNKFKQSGVLNRSGHNRFSYIVKDNLIALFIAGNEFNLSNSYLSLVSYFCSRHIIDYVSVMQCCDEDAALELLFKFHCAGYFFFYE